jgi:hypothetical protein
MFLYSQCGMIETKSPKKRDRKETKLHVLSAGRPPCWGLLASRSRHDAYPPHAWDPLHFTTFVNCSSSTEVVANFAIYLFSFFHSPLSSAHQAKGGLRKRRKGTAGAMTPARQQLSGAAHGGRGRGSGAGVVRALGGWASGSGAPAVWCT